MSKQNERDASKSINPIETEQICAAWDGEGCQGQTLRPSARWQHASNEKLYLRNWVSPNYPSPLLLITKKITLTYSPSYRLLDASTHLYKRVCLSVGPSAGSSVRPSVRRSVGLLFIFQIAEIDKSDKSNTCKSDKSDRILQIFVRTNLFS